MNNIFVNFIKGLGVGATMMIPGASGGTMCMILGIYNSLIEAVSTLFKKFKENAILLGTVLIGGCLGILLYAKCIYPLIEKFPLYSKIIFSVLLAISLVVFYKQTKIGIPDLKKIFFILLGVGSPFLIDFLMLEFSLDVNSLGGVPFYLFLLVLGILLAAALILPGISFSYMLVFFNIYDKTMDSVKSFDLLFLSFLGIGVAGGILLLSRPINYVLKKYPLQSNCMIAGFVISAIYNVIFK